MLGHEHYSKESSLISDLAASMFMLLAIAGVSLHLIILFTHLLVKLFMAKIIQ